MSDVTSHYIVRVKSVALTQYESLRSTLGKVMQHSGWVVHQSRFVEGARSLNEVEFKENLEYFMVPSASIDSIWTKLVMTKASYRSMGTTGDPVPVGHRDGPDHHFTG